MTTVKVDGEVSAARQELQNQFMEFSRDSFRKCIEALLKLDFYREVERRLACGIDITEDVPEAVGKSKVEIQQAIERLRVKATDAVTGVWQLSTAFQKILNSSVRKTQLDTEIYPQFDVEHVAVINGRDVKIHVETWRRSLKVEVLGRDEDVSELSRQLLIATMWQ